ncbi:MAG TPA: inorganic phosphate transporter [Gemmatimonadaceae bacterium]|nr:inorganic phosphate transporter [Gemmatimonadaceae bacterium]
MITYIIAIIAIAFIFDFSNGFHDSANSIATVVGTRVLKPLHAVVWAAAFNFLAAFTVGTAVAKTMGAGMVDVSVVDPNVILGALLGALFWNIITWYYGLPSSSSHALIGGYGGAAVAKAGFGAIIASGWTKTLIFIVLSPVIGMLLGFGLMVAVYWLFHRTPPGKVDRIFRVAQLASAAFFSLSHGANDAQKTMGIIVGLLASSNALFAAETGFLHHMYVPNAQHIPYWVEIGAYTAISLGTLFGGWRIVHTMGSRITKLRPVGGFCAETGGALSILLATSFGIPVSTTHTITGAIVGVGATNRLSAVRWGVAGRIVWAWILTIPAAALMSAIVWYALHGLLG